jgi:serine/threonine protein phosphatase PrpC
MNSHDELRRDLSDVLSENWIPLEGEVAAATHQGHVRDNNEDSYFLMRFGRSLEKLATNLEDYFVEENYSITGYGLLVADGMGGMAAGDVASRMAICKLIELVVDTSDWTLALKRNKDVKTVLERMTRRFYDIDRTLKQEASQDHTLSGMGTTLTVAGTLGNDLVLGHVGDSRAYLLRGDIFRQLTRDHTLAQMLIDAGVANSDDPAPRSMRHVLTAAIGSLDERIEPQVQRFRLQGGDQLLLCTDGLTEMVDDELIASVLREASSAQLACTNLVDLALGAGGTDNITVVVARFNSSKTEQR